ncbi:MAG: endopeptidase La [Oscillospiraceae bacterium]|nr:endopeptidase La [Oscillospiraceae bacterium]
MSNLQDNDINKTPSVELMTLMAIRGITVFPDMALTFDVERPFSLAALKAAYKRDRRLFLVAQRDILKDKPLRADLYDIGTVCVVKQFVKNGNGMRIMVEGKSRARLLDMVNADGHNEAKIELIEDRKVKITTRVEACMRKASELFARYAELSAHIAAETLIKLAIASDPGHAADFIAQNMFLKYTENQEILEILDPVKRLNRVNVILAREIEVLGLEEQISGRVNAQIAKIQKDNILREQIKAIKNELGEDDGFDELDEYRDKIAALRLAEDIEEKLFKEVDRLEKQPFGSSEASVIRSYLDTCIELPWNSATKDRLNIEQVRKILDRDHYGLQKVKERILEYLSVRKLAPDNNGTILCLVGPPGVGKTSVAISIARAMNRKLARMSLGGIHDEAEIRGHRKTYVGSMPGRIINAMIQCSSKNPLMLLDEIDKLGSDHRGDPASALLEVLDPEQNTSFRDNFLEIPFDLSGVFFITTANTTDTIPRPLLDRMEIIELTSYTDEEKLHIAREHLIAKQRVKHGLSARQLKISDGAVRDMITYYTRESGVRQLEREIAHICRKTAAKIVEGGVTGVNITSASLGEYLGVKKFSGDRLMLKDEVGIVNGLAWTYTGGELLEVEVNVLDGSGKIELTGNLGDVMKESARTAVSYIRSRTDKLGIEHDFYKTKDIHIHFPEGAVPKDGPSAGITIATALISALTGAPARSDVAMTGEITLRGRILPIGGLKEKTMAALRNGIKTVIIPSENEKDLDEIDRTVRRSLEFVTASSVDGILDIALDFSQREANKLDICAAAQKGGKKRPSISQ